MKNFNQLVNESSGLKLTRDYSRFLLEQQAFVAQKTCAILFGEETDYDGSDDTSNDPPFNSHLSGQFYAHINVDGARKVRVFNSAQEAALAIQKYPGSMIYNFKGDEVDPNQVKVTESVQRFNIFEDEASDYTKSELKKRAPEDEGGIWNSLARAIRSKEKGAAVAMANNNSFIARNLQNVQNALIGMGAFGADRTPEQTMQERDAEVKKLRDKLDAYEMEQRGKGFRKVEEIPLSDEETKDVQTFIKQRKEQQDGVGPMMPGVAERIVGLPREQLKAYQDFYKTATAYQGKALQDYYDQNPDKYSTHEPYMDTKTAVALKPISRSEDEGSSMPGRLKGTSFDSAAKLVAGLPETAAMVAAGIVAPELVGALVGGAGRIVPTIARVSSGAAAKAATAQAINTAVGIAGVDKLANAKDVVQGAEGAVMAATIADPILRLIREPIPGRPTSRYEYQAKERKEAKYRENEKIEREMRTGRVNPEQTSSTPSFSDVVDGLKGTVKKAGTELVNWMKPGTSVQPRASTPKRTYSQVLADTKYATRQAAKDISTGVKETGAAKTAAQLAAVTAQAVPAVVPDISTPPAIRASAPDVWKPTRNMDLMVSEPAKAPRSNANPEPVSVTPKGEVIKVTPTPEPVDRKSIDAFVKSLLPSAANRTTSTQPTTNVPPPTASPSTPSDTPTTQVPSAVTDTTTAPTTVPAPATSTTTAPSTSTVPVTAPTVAPTIAPTVTPDIAPVTDPIVNKIVNTLIAAAAIGGGSKLLPGKKGGGGGGGGGGAGGRIGGDPAEREELKRQKQETDAQAKNWDLMMKNIWGKNVETLTK